MHFWIRAFSLCYLLIGLCYARPRSVRSLRSIILILLRAMLWFLIAFVTFVIVIMFVLFFVAALIWARLFAEFSIRLSW